MASGEPTRTLWMGDLEPYMDEFFILQAFDTMGEPAVQVKLIHNKTSGLPAGYCFVDFADSEASLRAQLRLNGKIIPNSQPPHRFKLNSNNVKDQIRREFSLFVGDLSDEVDDFILFRAFVKKYSSCLTAKVVLDSRGRTKGYGFVRFSEETDQQRALIEMQHTIGIGRKPIRVSLATPKRGPDNNNGPPARSQPNMQNPQANYNNMYENYYTQYYQQYYANYYAQQQQLHTPAQPPLPPVQPSYSVPPPAAPATNTYYNPDDDPNALEDPELEIDIDRYNREYMAQSEEIFDILEDSRWHPMDQWNSTVPATAR